ncbi:MAG TPA: MarR family transcriptional regulator, partial [Ktedonobacterales bacterium]|nr:MarR family transcriptional regulator [Ktedonobacterales bacterium]
MSSGPQEGRARLHRELTRELRQVVGLGAAYFRAAAARLGMPVTDLHVIDILESGGPMTAGQLAELTGLTTGAITGMINRLEKSGLIQRGSDPEDARRV